MAAEQARKFDPQLAAKYKRLIAADRHHDSAVCHIATILLTRIATCWRIGQPYQIRDLDGTPLTMAEGKTDRRRTPPGAEEEGQGQLLPRHQPQGRPGATEVAKRSNIPACRNTSLNRPKQLEIP